MEDRACLNARSPGRGCRPGPGRRASGPGRPEPLSDLLARRLLAQRVVLLHGPLDDLSVTRVSAELMTLDADGDDPVTLRVDCGEAALAPALTLMDVIELMGVPVRALCLGQVGVGRRRRGRGLRASCCHAEHPLLAVRAGDPAAGPRAQRGPVGRAARRRAAAFLRPGGCRHRAAAAAVEADLERGRFLGAEEAVDYGILDEVCRPDAPVRRLPGSGPPPMGFRPLR